MKKLLALVLCLALVFTFAACGKEDSKEDSKEDIESTSKVESEVNVDPAPEATSLKTVNSGKLTMGTNAYFQPYEFYKGKDIVGIDAEIAGKVAEKLGLELEIKDMEFSSIISAVQAGDVDFGMAAMTKTADREKEIDFTISYANGVQSIVVKEGSKIKSVDDVNSKCKIGVQLGTTGDTYASGDYGKDAVTQYTTGNEAIAALLGGGLDCVIIDNQPAKAFVANNAGLKILDTPYADEDYAACIKKGNTALKDAFDKALEELIADGTVDAIVAKYIHE